jgi:hypothetical protein
MMALFVLVLAITARLMPPSFIALALWTSRIMLEVGFTTIVLYWFLVTTFARCATTSARFDQQLWFQVVVRLLLLRWFCVAMYVMSLAPTSVLLLCSVAPVVGCVLC